MRRYFSFFLLCLLCFTLNGCTLESQEAQAHARHELEDLQEQLRLKEEEISELEEEIEDYKRSLEISWEEYAALKEQNEKLKQETKLYSLRTCIVMSGDYKYHTYECLADSISITSEFEIYTIHTARNYGYEPHTCIN